MYEAILNGKVIDFSLAYAPLEIQYAGTSVKIRNTKTGVTWFADQELQAQAQAMQENRQEQ